MDKGVVSKQTGMLHQWGSETQKFGFNDTAMVPP